MKTLELLLAASVTAAAPAALVGQDTNIILPVHDIETMFAEKPLEVVSVTPSRGLPSERTYQVTARLDGQMVLLKYAPAKPGADDFNNQPRYELAAYEIQKLFLDEGDYVVPPTVARCFPLDDIRAVLAKAPSPELIEPPEPTFAGWNMGLVVLQYWLWNVEVPEPRDLDDNDRLKDDTYARHVGNFNLLTYLIRHNDSNKGNFLISSSPENPRVFSVDNGVAFDSEVSDRGNYWRDLRLDRYPRQAIERLRGHTLEDLKARLGVLAQFEVRGGQFVQTSPTENLDPGDGVRHDATRIQLGLTDSEIESLYRRLTRLLQRVDEGRYELF